MTRSTSNAQPHKPGDELPGHVKSSPCSFDVLSSSPTTVAARTVEDLWNLNSCKRSANIVIIPQEKKIQKRQFLCLKFSSLKYLKHIFVYKTAKGLSQIWNICILSFSV